MKINSYGQIELTEQEVFEHLYTGDIQNLSNIFLTDKQKVIQFNQAKSANADNIADLKILTEPNCTIQEFDKLNQKDWFMPQDYFPNLIEWLYTKCQTQEQTNRVSYELELFTQHNMVDLLFYLKYLVDTMREHNIVWGVGRGSSVASYVLFLLDIHKIDSIKYNLDVHEFFK